MNYNDLCKIYKDDTNHNDIVSDLKLVVSYVIGVDYSEINQFTDITQQDIKKIHKLMKKHLKGKPIQKLLGHTIFYDCYIGYSDAVLTPRMDTELLVEKVIEHIGNKKLKVLDLCSGSGCIGIAIAKHTKANVVLADISKKAILECKKNAKYNSVDVETIYTDMFNAIEEKFDIIVCNPPYITESEYKTLDKLVKKYDPKLALVALDNGLKFYKIIANEGYKYLNKNGKIFLEIGYNQGKSVVDLFKNDYYGEVELIKDYSDNDRIVIIDQKGE